MPNDKLLNLLGIAQRARKLSCGHDAAQSAIKHSHARLCILSSDASDRLKAEFIRACEADDRNIPVIETKYTMHELGYATSLRSAVITVDDRGFSKRIIEIFNEN